LLKRIILIISIMAAVLTPGVIAARTDLFGGNELGAQQASDSGQVTQVKEQASDQGLTIEIGGIVGDAGGTAISYRIMGRSDEGELVMPAAPPHLKDDRGNEFRATRASWDQIDKRRGTIVFPPIPQDATLLTVSFESFRIVRDADRDNPTLVEGSWAVSIEWTARTAGSETLAGFPMLVEFGRGSLRIESVTTSVLGIVVRGQIEGFEPETIQSLGCPIEALRSETDGSALGFANCRLGFGPGYRAFEVTFPTVSGTHLLQARVAFTLDSDGKVPDEDVRVDEGSTSEILLDLP
jgi:hypothetical protein